MDKREALTIAKKYIDFIKPFYDVQGVILFGSFAKGNQHQDSDIDLAIILNQVEDIIDAQAKMMSLRRKIDLRIEPHPFFVDDFNKSNPVANEILSHGIVI